MEFLPELLPAEMLEPVEENKPATVDDGKKVEMEIKKLNEPPLEEPEPEEESPFKAPPPKRRGEPKKKRTRKKEEVEHHVVYEKPESEEEELPEREDKIIIDPKREKRLENLKKAREARKAKAEYKKKTPKLKPALEPEPSIRETFNTHLQPTEEEKQKIMMEREHYQFMNFMSNMEKYKNFKKGFKMAQMEDEIIEKEKRKQVKKVPQKVPEKTTPSIIKNNEPFNEYSKYFG